METITTQKYTIKKDLIFNYMKENNLKVLEFCKKADIDFEIYVRLMLFECSCPKFELEKIAKLLKVNISDLLESNVLVIDNLFEDFETLLDCYEEQIETYMKNYRRNKKSYRDM